jgi:hypothetical protein
VKFRKQLLKSAAACSVLLVSLMGGQLPGGAVGPDLAVVVGGGTISPGLTTVPAAQTFTFSTTIGVAAGATNHASLPDSCVPTLAGCVGTSPGAAVVTPSCSFSGGSTLAGGETALVGQGVGSGSCATATGIVGSMSIACTITYTRVGLIVIVVLSCQITVNGNTNNRGTEIAVCEFGPTTVNPTTSYVLACAVPGAIDNP